MIETQVRLRTVLGAPRNGFGAISCDPSQPTIQISVGNTITVRVENVPALLEGLEEILNERAKYTGPRTV